MVKLWTARILAATIYLAMVAALIITLA